MLRLLLDLLYLIASPVLLIAWLIATRGLTRRRHREGILQKLLGPARLDTDRPVLWVHAVSVGEVRTVAPLLEALTRTLPDWQLAISTSTDTGHEVARGLLPRLAPDAHLFYAPLDLSFSVARSLEAIRPRAILLVELELWPNFLLTARSRDVPVFVVNGRLSERSARRYQAAGPLARSLFARVTSWAVQDEACHERLTRLGVPGDRLVVTGNLKYDVPAPEMPATRQTRDLLPGFEGPVLVAGCTHPGEEKILLEVHRKLLGEHSGLRLVLAPRHVERAAEVIELCRSGGKPDAETWSRVETGEATAGFGILVVDRIGQLDRFYDLADVTFIGGSLVPRGGHNLLEAARLGKPVVQGPSSENFAELVAHFREHSAVTVVEGPGELETALRGLLEDAGERRRRGERAREASRALGGAVERHLAWLRPRLGLPARGSDGDSGGPSTSRLEPDDGPGNGDAEGR